ncbi:hypothetical protein [Corynebacterium sp. CNCTC7651]|uniref:hypothetical protein n=1 Tax=Corynebacterium TaxID=1716 RepID=UPI00351D5D48
MDLRKDLVWQSIVGFVGFFTALALIQAVVNVFRPEPAVWPALFAAVMITLEVLLVRRWLRWRRSQEPESR